MDTNLKKRSLFGKGIPVIVLANWYQFGRGETADRPCVESRMFLWCLSGRGRVTVNGRDFMLEAGRWILLPWRHVLRYEADGKSPFLVGGIHLVPCHDRTERVTFRVAHSRTDALAGHPARRDARWPDLRGVIVGEFRGERDPLAHLAAYVVERFQQAPPDRGLAESQAAMVLDELRRARSRIAGGRRPQPAALRRMQEYVRSHLRRALSVDDLAGVGGCSPATVHRLFQAGEAMPPGAWMAAVRADRAAFLLRTTRLSVRAIGEEVGFADPFHFSRAFKREMGTGPRAYRQNRGSF